MNSLATWLIVIVIVIMQARADNGENYIFSDLSRITIYKLSGKGTDDILIADFQSDLKLGNLKSGASYNSGHKLQGYLVHYFFKNGAFAVDRLKDKITESSCKKSIHDDANLTLQDLIAMLDKLNQEKLNQKARDDMPQHNNPLDDEGK